LGAAVKYWRLTAPRERAGKEKRTHVFASS
jgi:hypothetical protein